MAIPIDRTETVRSFAQKVTQDILQFWQTIPELQITDIENILSHVTVSLREQAIKVLEKQNSSPEKL